MVEEIINDAVDESQSSQQLIAMLDRRKECLEGAGRQEVDAYIKGVRPQINDMLVKDLGENIGGECTSSSITMGKSSLYVFTTTEDAIARTKEVSKHEHYHQEHHHTAPMIAGASATGDHVVTIGGRSFTDTALIEGITVDQTGDQFVSSTYVRYQQDLRSAVASAGITIGDVEDAIDDQDLRPIDDRETDVISEPETNSPPVETSIA